MTQAEIDARLAIIRAEKYLEQLRDLGTPWSSPFPRYRRWEVVTVAAGRCKTATVEADNLYETNGALRFVRIGADGIHGEIHALYAAGAWNSVREL